jgi:hypothetical protein
MTAAARRIAPARERPILFSGLMVRQIIAGKKTVTRRTVRTIQGRGMRLLPCIGSRTAMYLLDGMGPAWCPAGGDPPEPWPADRYGEISPYGAAGDRLWVKETFAPAVGHDDALTMPEYEGGHNPTHLYYRADVRKGMIDGCDEDRIKWKPSIFMPRWASRITLAVVSVRIERLHAITEEDAALEGFPLPGPVKARQRVTHPDGRVEKSIVDLYDFTARGGFCHLWDGINGKRAPWASNPWVWRIAFRVCEESV